MKFRTDSELQEYLDKEFAWRLQEIDFSEDGCPKSIKRLLSHAHASQHPVGLCTLGRIREGWC